MTVQSLDEFPDINQFFHPENHEDKQTLTVEKCFDKINI